MFGSGQDELGAQDLMRDNDSVEIWLDPPHVFLLESCDLETGACILRWVYLCTVIIMSFSCRCVDGHSVL